METRLKRWKEGKEFLVNFINELQKFAPSVISECQEKSGQIGAENYKIFIKTDGMKHSDPMFYPKPSIFIHLTESCSNGFKSSILPLAIEIIGYDNGHMTCKLSEMEALVEVCKSLSPEIIQAKIQEAW